MKHRDPFQEFAPAILRIYRRDEDAFWAAVMAPFLANQVSLLKMMIETKQTAEGFASALLFKRNE
jgi:hypothetical protein